MRFEQRENARFLKSQTTDVLTASQSEIFSRNCYKRRLPEWEMEHKIKPQKLN